MAEVYVAKLSGTQNYGITDGKKWFFYFYTSPFAANSVIRACNGFNDPMVRNVNISYDNPHELSTFTG